MKKIVPINTTADGCAFTVVTRYEARAYLKSMTSGGGTTRVRECWKYPMNTTLDGCCKTIYGRMGRLSWENYLGRIEHGGWDCQMTCIMEVYEKTDKHNA